MEMFWMPKVTVMKMIRVLDTESKVAGDRVKSVIFLKMRTANGWNRMDWGLTIDSTLGAGERSKMGLEGFMLVVWKVVEEGREGEVNELRVCL
jgi:hypothetical protein